MESGPLVPANGYPLREVQPAYPIEFTRHAPPNTFTLHVQDSVLRDYLRVLIKRKWLVISTVLLILSVVGVATLRSTRIYQASGSIAINRVDPAMLTLGSAAASSPDYYYDPSDLDTEVSILRSDLLALQVIRTLNLDKRPGFGGTGTQPNALPLTTDDLQADSSRANSLIGAFKGNLRVNLRPNTGLSTSATAARIRNWRQKSSIPSSTLISSKTSKPVSNPRCRLRIGCRNN
jgi:hypothetical protein